MKKYLFVGLGGMIGSLLRFGVSIPLTLDTSFPWEILIVNISGSFILTYLFLAEGIRSKLPPVMHQALTVGVIGSYTTFSAVIVESVQLLNNHPLVALIYIVTSVLACLSSCYLAYYISLQRRVT